MGSHMNSTLTRRQAYAKFDERYLFGLSAVKLCVGVAMRLLIAYAELYSEN